MPYTSGQKLAQVKVKLILRKNPIFFLSCENAPFHNTNRSPRAFFFRIKFERDFRSGQAQIGAWIQIIYYINQKLVLQPLERVYGTCKLLN